MSGVGSESSLVDNDYRDYELGGILVFILLSLAVVAYLVDDGTGEVVVDPAGADFEFEDKTVFRIESTEDANENIREFVGDEGGPGGLVFENDRKYMEWIILPEEAF